VKELLRGQPVGTRSKKRQKKKTQEKEKENKKTKEHTKPKKLMAGVGGEGEVGRRERWWGGYCKGGARVGEE